MNAPTSPPDDRPVRPEGWMLRLTFPAVLLGLLVGLTVVIWHLKSQVDRREAEIALQRSVFKLADHATTLIDGQIGSLRRMAELMKTGVLTGDPSSAKVAGANLPADSAWQTIALVDREGICRWMWTTSQEAEFKEGCPVPAGTWAQGIDRVRVERQARFVEVVRRNTICETRIAIPVIVGEGTSATYIGSIAGRLNLDRALRPLIEDAGERMHDFVIMDRSQVVLEHGLRIDAGDALAQDESLRVVNRALRLRARPTAALLARHGGHSASWILWVGLPASVGIAGGLWGILRHRARLVDESKRQLLAMDSLSKAAGVVATNPRRDSGVLDRIAATARQAIGVSKASISVLDEQRLLVDMVAFDGFGTLERPAPMPYAEATGTIQCITSGQILIVEDVDADLRINRDALRRMNIRSAMFVPLRVDAKSVGVLYLSDDRPRRFTADQIQLAKIMGNQAAVILASHRLVEQMDAALVMQKQHAEQREALLLIASEIYRFDGLSSSLQNLTDAAPAIMKVDLCVACLLAGKGQRMRIAAITGNYAKVCGEEFDAGNTPATTAFREHRIIVVEDASKEPLLHPAYRHRLHIGSLIYLPLTGGDDSPMGLLIMIRHQSGAFTREQLELGAALSARASAAIEKARLYEEARAAAQSQEMLLRELNHRVKNNLSSIVTLLTVNRPGMPEEARLWLNRVTGRVATMARTHGLFVGANASVKLDELLSRLLPGLSAIKPGGVEIRSELTGQAVPLDIESAISLAMVLNELCWNALEHGTPENGVLRIRAHGADGRLTIEIEDQGLPQQSTRGDAPAMESGSPRGMGLRLVHGMITRELKGRFQLERKAAGGSIAKIDVPLAATKVEA